MELKPCPFCGGEAYVMTWREERQRINPTIVRCASCEVQTNLYDRKKEAIAAWNRRYGDGSIR